VVEGIANDGGAVSDRGGPTTSSTPGATGAVVHALRGTMVSTTMAASHPARGREAPTRFGARRIAKGIGPVRPFTIEH